MLKKFNDKNLTKRNLDTRSGFLNKLFKKIFKLNPNKPIFSRGKPSICKWSYAPNTSFCSKYPPDILPISESPCPLKSNSKVLNPKSFKLETISRESLLVRFPPRPCIKIMVRSEVEGMIQPCNLVGPPLSKNSISLCLF